MNRILAFVFLLLTVFGAFILPSHAQTGPLNISLTPVSAKIRGDADVLLKITITNPTSLPVTVPVWQLPSDDVPTPILQITAADGSPVAYTGPLIKWSPEALQTGVIFAPGSTQVFVIELSSIYDIENGRYRIEYSQNGPGKFDLQGRTSRVFAPIAPAFIETTGRTKRIRGEVSPSNQMSAASLTTFRCTTSQSTAIRTAVSDATNYARAAGDYFTGKSTAMQVTLRYTKWFGAATDARLSRVTSNYNKLYSAFSTQSVSVDCSCKKKTVYAYVYPNQPYQIYVCGAFWRAPAIGTDSKAGTLIHEMSHFNVVAGTFDYVYGQSGAQSLAMSDPDKATANADNHEYFAENNPPQQ